MGEVYYISLYFCRRAVLGQAALGRVDILWLERRGAFSHPFLYEGYWSSKQQGSIDPWMVFMTLKTQALASHDWNGIYMISHLKFKFNLRVVDSDLRNHGSRSRE